MTRESDEACLALIASIRDRAQRLMIDGAHASMYGTHSEVDRLMGNLEARINGDVRRAWYAKKPPEVEA